MESGEWKKYYDEASGYYYWHNEQTGESQWDYEDSAEEGIELVLNPISQDEGKAELEEVDSDDEGTSIKQTRGSNTTESKEDSNSNRIYSDFLYYYRCLLINAVFIEAPLAVLEGVLRSFSLTALGICIFLRRVWTYREICGPVNELYRVYYREVILTLAATLSIALPFMICYVYRKYSLQDDWDLTPIPTILGYVDVRRFGAISLNGGSLAKNVDELFLKKTNKREKMLDRKSQDQFWPGEIIYVPRKIMKQIQTTLDGN